MSLLDHAAPRILPRLFDERVQVPWTSGWLRFPFRGNAELRFRSLWGFVGHVPTPWIYGFARRYISRPGSSKAPRLWGETIKPFPPTAVASPRDARLGGLRFDRKSGIPNVRGNKLDIPGMPSLSQPCSWILRLFPRYGTTPRRSAWSEVELQQPFDGYPLPWPCTPGQRRWRARPWGYGCLLWKRRTARIRSQASSIEPERSPLSPRHVWPSRRWSSCWSDPTSRDPLRRSSSGRRVPSWSGIELP